MGVPVHKDNVTQKFKKELLQERDIETVANISAHERLLMRCQTLEEHKPKWHKEKESRYSLMILQKDHGKSWEKIKSLWPTQQSSPLSVKGAMPRVSPKRTLTLQMLARCWLKAISRGRHVTLKDKNEFHPEDGRIQQGVTDTNYVHKNSSRSLQLHQLNELRS